MKRTLHLGKVDYNETGRENCAVDLEIELRHIGPTYTTTGEIVQKQTTDHRMLAEYNELSVCGSIWNPGHSDIYSGGQNIDEIAALFPHNRQVQRIHAIWSEWHLNDMTSGCIHQPDEWTCTHQPEEHDADIAALQQMIEALYERRAETSEIATTKYHLQWTEEVRALAHAEPVLNGWTIAREMRSEGKTAPPNISKIGGTFMTHKSHGFRGDACVVCGRARWDEPSDKCPETGYRYGTSWLVRVLPPEIEAEITAILQPKEA
jgi:hypothetical protein